MSENETVTPEQLEDRRLRQEKHRLELEAQKLRFDERSLLEQERRTESDIENSRITAMRLARENRLDWIWFTGLLLAALPLIYATSFLIVQHGFAVK